MMTTASEARLESAAMAAQADVVVAQNRLGIALAARRDAVLQLRAEGWSFQRIADLLSVTKTAAVNICRSL